VPRSFAIDRGRIVYDLRVLESPAVGPFKEHAEIWRTEPISFKLLSVSQSRFRHVRRLEAPMRSVTLFLLVVGAAVGAVFAPIAEAHELDLASAWIVATAIGDSDMPTQWAPFCARIGEHRVDCALEAPEFLDTGTEGYCAGVVVVRLGRRGRLSTSGYACATREEPVTPERAIPVPPPTGLSFTPLVPEAVLDSAYMRRLLSEPGFAQSIRTPYGRARWLGRRGYLRLWEWAGTTDAGDGLDTGPGSVTLRTKPRGNVFLLSTVTFDLACFDPAGNLVTSTSALFRLDGVHIRRDGTFSTKGVTRDINGNIVQRFALRGRIGVRRLRIRGTARYQQSFGDSTCKRRTTWTAHRVRGRRAHG
jgi:hypothetical protein